MTREEKDLLLKDLCMRLSCGVICHVKYIVNNETTYGKDVLTECDDELVRINFDNQTVYTAWLTEYSDIEDILPYLRPMSSMTDEEKATMDKIWTDDNKLVFADPDDIRRYRFYDISIVDFLNKHHFDYRGLIDLSLALPASEGMYKI